MDVIQQKLIWLLGSGAILILLFKLNLRRAVADKSVLTRLRIGFALMFSGALMGIISKVGMSTGSLSQPGPVLFIESIGGYVLGWTFIIAAGIRWTRGYFDQKGKPLATINARAISEKVAASLIKGHRPGQLLDSIALELMDILNCQAITLHKFEEESGLQLTYENGLAAGHKDMVNAPVDRKHMFWKASRTGQAVISDKDMVFGDGSRLSSESGPLKTAISVPVIFENNTMGVLTVYSVDLRAFGDDDLKMLEIVTDSLGIVLENEISEKKYNMVSRYREMLIMAARPFENGESLISALIKSAKLIHGYIPFRRITLFVHGDGEPYESDFTLSTGGVVSVKSGYFPKLKFSELYLKSGDTNGWGVSARGITISSDQKTYLFDVSGGGRLLANLKIDLGEPTGKSSYMPLLGAALCQRITERLEAEQIDRIKEKTGQWLGALEYFQAKGLLAENLQTYLKELASLVVDLTPVTFSRIIFVDNKRENFRTVALAQSRALKWPEMNTSNVSLPKTSLHRKVLEANYVARYGENIDMESTLGVEELRTLIPEGTKHGLIIPLYMGKKTVGMLTVGESREFARQTLKGETESFINSIAALISMVLTWHKDKRSLADQSEGKKSLKLMKKEKALKSPQELFSPSLRTRLNGPLAGILASCEYLRSQDDAYDHSEIDRYLEIIQKNATKIHNMTLNSGKKSQKVVG